MQGVRFVGLDNLRSALFVIQCSDALQLTMDIIAEFRERIFSKEPAKFTVPSAFFIHRIAISVCVVLFLDNIGITA
jgi:hypothetical protein